MKNERLLKTFKEPTSHTLYCFHHAGGNAFVFQSWVSHLPAGMGLKSIQLPGRFPRNAENPYVTMHALLDDLASEFSHFPSDSFSFFGHSFGAMLAFCLAGRMKKKLLPQPTHIFLSSFYSPDVFLEKRFDDRRLALFDLDTNKVLKTDMLILDSLSAEMCIKVDCPIVLFGARQDYDFLMEKMLNWQDFTYSSFASHLFAGDHFYIRSAYPEVLKIIDDTVCS